MIGLRSNTIYDIFIIEWSCKDISRNVSNKFLSSHDHMQSFDRQPIDTSK